MPDQRVEDLGQSQTLTKDALLYNRNDPNGTPSHRKIPLTSFHTPLPGAARLNGNVSASDTSVSLRTELDTLGTNLGWIVIDPFTTECEIRKIASLSGNGATLNLHEALDNSHSQDNAVLWMPYPTLSLELFGAVGDGSTDDSSAIQNALTHARNLAPNATRSQSGIIVRAGPGDFMLGNQVVSPTLVSLRGEGRSATAFKALPGFTNEVSIRTGSYKWTASGSGTNEYYLEASGGGDPDIINPARLEINSSVATKGTVGSLSAGEWGWDDNDSLGYDTVYVRLSGGGDPDAQATDYIKALYAMMKLGDTFQTYANVLERLTIHGDNTANIGVYSDTIQELSGLEKMDVRRCEQYGICIEPGEKDPQNYFIRDIALTMYDTSLSAVGLYLDGGFAAPRGVIGVTSNSNQAITANVQLERIRGGHFTQIHTENGADGILIGQNGTTIASTVISGFVGNAHTNAVHIASGATVDDLLLQGIEKGSGTTNVLKDEANGDTLTDTRLGLYLIGDLRASGGYRSIIDGWIVENVAASQTAEIIDRFGQSGNIFANYVSARAGSVVAISVFSNLARSAGTLTVEVHKNGSATGLSTTLDASNTTENQTLALPDTYSFGAGDRLDVRVTTDGSWAPTTADITCSLEVET